MNKKRGWTLALLNAGLAVAGIILYVIAIAAGGLAMGEADAEEAALAGMVVLLLFAILLLLGGMAALVAWYATSNSDLNRITGGGFNTILWTFLLFVPIANIVSMYKLADHIHQAQNARGVTGLHPVVVFLLLWLVSFVGVIVAQLQMDKVGEVGGGSPTAASATPGAA